MCARIKNTWISPVDNGNMPQVGMQPDYMDPTAGIDRRPTAHQRPPQPLPQNQALPCQTLPPVLLLLFERSQMGCCRRLRLLQTESKVQWQWRASKAAPLTTPLAPASVSEPAPSQIQATRSCSGFFLKRPREEEALVQSTSTGAPRSTASDETSLKRARGELAEVSEAKPPNRQIDESEEYQSSLLSSQQCAYLAISNCDPQWRTHTEKEKHADA
ncbi:hypothetical protein DFH11DRAFT_1639460 [Phellopilus nigrolimitatus]|nr:hypothetical protein DFH11DRAFT_1639460 [Phellopilus nigrolimitatus]